MMKIGFIDYYLDEWHANNYPKWIREATEGEMEVAYAYGQIPSPITNMTSAQWCEKHGITLCQTIEQVIDKSDFLIVLSPDNCEMHESLCQLPLRSGKPTYVDKTFAPDLATAKRIFTIAKENNTPCCSTSALRYATEYQQIDRKDITAVSCWGAGDLDTYSIHQIEPLMMLMQAPAEKVLYVETEGWYQLLLTFADGRMGGISGGRVGAPFLTNITYREGRKLLNITSDFFQQFIIKMVEFFRTCHIDFTPEDTLRIMAVRTAAMQAQKNPGIWTDVPEV